MNKEDKFIIHAAFNLLYLITSFNHYFSSIKNSMKNKRNSVFALVFSKYEWFNLDSWIHYFEAYLDIKI